MESNGSKKKLIKESSLDEYDEKKEKIIKVQHLSASGGSSSGSTGPISKDCQVPSQGPSKKYMQDIKLNKEAKRFLASTEDYFLTVEEMAILMKVNYVEPACLDVEELQTSSECSSESQDSDLDECDLIKKKKTKKSQPISIDVPENPPQCNM